MLRGQLEAQAIAAETEPPRTRKRFKSAGSRAVPASMSSQKKRALPEHEAEPASSQRKVDPVAPVPGLNQELSELVWEPVFDLASGCTTRASPSLVPAEHKLLYLLRESGKSTKF